MSDDEELDSFAARAAAWVPPWLRDSAETGPEAEVAAEPAGVEVESVGAEPASGVAAEPEVEAEPAGVEAEPAGVEPAAEVATEPAVEPEPAEVVAVAQPQPELVAEPVAEPEPQPVAVPVEDEPELVAEPVDEEQVVVEPEPVAAVEPVVVEPTGDEPAIVSDEPVDTDGVGAPTDVPAALEAILMVVDEPVTEQMLAQVLEQPTERIASELERLAEEYAVQRRGFQLRRAAGGWRFYTHPDQAPYVERFVLDGQSIRLTQAALETLAVVAYKQPVTRSRISAIRGVNCDGVVRTLVTRGLIQECGTEPETGAHLYQTTNLFLEKLGLDSVEQLPSLAPFLPDDVDAIADAGR